MNDTFGVIVPDLADPFFAWIVGLIEQRRSSAGLLPDIPMTELPPSWVSSVVTALPTTSTSW